MIVIVHNHEMSETHGAEQNVRTLYTEAVENLHTHTHTHTHMGLSFSALACQRVYGLSARPGAQVVRTSVWLRMLRVPGALYVCVCVCVCVTLTVNADVFVYAIRSTITSSRSTVSPYRLFCWLLV